WQYHHERSNGNGAWPRRGSISRSEITRMLDKLFGSSDQVQRELSVTTSQWNLGRRSLWFVPFRVIWWIVRYLTERTIHQFTRNGTKHKIFFLPLPSAYWPLLLRT